MSSDVTASALDVELELEETGSGDCGEVDF